MAGFSRDFSFYIPKTWNIDNVRAVAFVANYNATDKNDCRVLNTEELRVRNISSPTGILESNSCDDSSWQIVSASGITLDSGNGEAELARSIDRQASGILVVRTKAHTVKIFR